MLEPYFRYLGLRSDRYSGPESMKLAAPVQVHSFLGTKKIPGYVDVFETTSKRIRKKFQGGVVGDSIPTAACLGVPKLKLTELDLSRIALSCIVPSSRREVSRRLRIHQDTAQSILTALAHKKVVDALPGTDTYLFSILRKQPISGSPEFTSRLPDMAFLGWMDAQGLDEHSMDGPAKDYFTIVPTVKSETGKGTKDIIVFDMLRTPGASPGAQPLEKGQLSYLFERVYESPVHEAALFATLGMPQTMDEVRDAECSKPVSDVLDDVWSKARMYKFIDQEYRTTPHGERVMDTISGTPLSSYQHLDTIDRFLSKYDISWENPREYRSEFLKVIYTGLLHKVLSENCGAGTAMKMITDSSNVRFYLETLATDKFYQPSRLAEKLGIDDTAAKNVYANAFRYGACGVSTTSHPHLFKPTRKATMKARKR